MVLTTIEFPAAAHPLQRVCAALYRLGGGDNSNAPGVIAHRITAHSYILSPTRLVLNRYDDNYYLLLLSFLYYYYEHVKNRVLPH